MEYIDQEILNRVQQLPLEQKQQVLKFVDELYSKHVPHQPYESVNGLWADLGVDLSEEEIDEARREMWSMSPKQRAR